MSRIGLCHLYINKMHAATSIVYAGKEYTKTFDGLMS